MKKLALIACLLATSALVACSSEPDPHPEFGAMGDHVISTILWQGGNKYEHYAYGGFAGNLELVGITTPANTGAVYEFKVVASNPQKMPLNFTFKLKVPEKLTGLNAAEHVVTCESCLIGSVQTFLAPVYVVLPKPKGN